MTPLLLQTKSNPNGIPRANFDALWAQWKSDYPKWVEDATAPFFVPETSRAMMRWVVNVLQSPVPINLACSRMMADEDFRDEMRKIVIPTLLVHGDRDRSAPIEVTGIPSAELISGCRFLIYKRRAARTDVYAHGSAPRRHPAVYERSAVARLMLATESPIADSQNGPRRPLQ